MGGRGEGGGDHQVDIRGVIKLGQPGGPSGGPSGRRSSQPGRSDGGGGGGRGSRGGPAGIRRGTFKTPVHGTAVVWCQSQRA